MTSPPQQADVDRFAAEHRRLLGRIRETTGIHDPRILDAFASVPRHAFVNPSQLEVAYADRALPLEEGQTISQPSMVAIMLKELDLDASNSVLEVGAGSGYAAALLGRLTRRVDSVEIRPQLAERARSVLDRLGFDNVWIHLADGRLGLPDLGPFDRILVSAAAVSIPSALAAQLAPGGSLAIPMGSSHGQELVIATNTGGSNLEIRRSVPCVFVPLVEG
jgi:protein-L-isoaspartate(D-aspartate) O-methyltransferase